MRTDVQLLLELAHASLTHPPRLPTMSAEEHERMRELFRTLTSAEQAWDTSSRAPAAEINNKGAMVLLCRPCC